MSYHGLQVFKSIVRTETIPSVMDDLKHGPVEERVRQGDGIKGREGLDRNKEQNMT